MIDADRLEAIVREAGRIAHDMWPGAGHALDTWEKGPNNPVCAADLAVDAFLKRELGALLPAAFLYALQRPNPGWVWPPLLCLLGNYWPPFYIDAARGDPFAWAVIASCALAPLFGLWLLRQSLTLPVPCVST